VFGSDRIDLSSIDADLGVEGNQALTFVAAAAFTANDQVRYVVEGDNIRIQVNLDSNFDTAEMEFLLEDPTDAADGRAVPDATDFVL